MDMIGVLLNQQSRDFFIIKNLLLEQSELMEVIIKRRRKMCILRRKNKMLIQALLALERKHINRRIMKMERSSVFWEEDVPCYSDEKFKEDFRMSRQSFDLLTAKLKCLERTDTSLRKCIPLDKRIGIFLYAIGSSAYYKTIAGLFGVGRSTVGEIVIETANAICNSLRQEYLNTYPPTELNISEIIQGFNSLGFPQCCGAIDVCHIEVCLPKEKAADYCNAEGWHSTMLLASVDYRCKFTYLDVGMSGRHSDTDIFEQSKLKREHETSAVLDKLTKDFNGTQVPVLLIADSEFRLANYVMKPYPFSDDMPQEKKEFNYRLSKCRRLIEDAFVHLKSRFRKLGAGLKVHIDNVDSIVKACCILHNFLNEHSDIVCEQWLVQYNNTNIKQQPKSATNLCDQHDRAAEIRDALAAHFAYLPKMCC